MSRYDVNEKNTGKVILTTSHDDADSICIERNHNYDEATLTVLSPVAMRKAARKLDLVRYVEAHARKEAAATAEWAVMGETLGNQGEIDDMTAALLAFCVCQRPQPPFDAESSADSLLDLNDRAAELDAIRRAPRAIALVKRAYKGAFAQAKADAATL